MSHRRRILNHKIIKTKTKKKNLTAAVINPKKILENHPVVNKNSNPLEKTLVIPENLPASNKTPEKVLVNYPENLHVSNKTPENPHVNKKDKPPEQVLVNNNNNNKNNNKTPENLLAKKKKNNNKHLTKNKQKFLNKSFRK